MVCDADCVGLAGVFPTDVDGGCVCFCGNTAGDQPHVTAWNVPGMPSKKSSSSSGSTGGVGPPPELDDDSGRLTSAGASCDSGRRFLLFHTFSLTLCGFSSLTVTLLRSCARLCVSSLCSPASCEVLDVLAPPRIVSATMTTSTNGKEIQAIKQTSKQ